MRKENKLALISAILRRHLLWSKQSLCFCRNKCERIYEKEIRKLAVLSKAELRFSRVPPFDSLLQTAWETPWISRLQPTFVFRKSDFSFYKRNRRDVIFDAFTSVCSRERSRNMQTKRKTRTVAADHPRTFKASRFKAPSWNVARVLDAKNHGCGIFCVYRV